jgi:predicted negative regulator of RcsB-dependent stress response
MAVDLEAIEDAAKSKTTKVVERLQTVYVDPPRFNLLTVLIMLVIAVCLVFGYGWYTAHKRDKWWRAEIAANSAGVNDAIKKANGELPDNEILKTIGDSDAALRTAEERLRQKPAPATDTCPIIPVGCVRVR